MKYIFALLLLLSSFAGFADETKPHIEVIKNGDPVTACKIGSCAGRGDSGWDMGHQVNSHTKKTEAYVAASYTIGSRRTGRRSTRRGRCLTRGCENSIGRAQGGEAPDAAHRPRYQLEQREYESIDEIREEHQREFAAAYEKARGINHANQSVKDSIARTMRLAAAQHNALADSVTSIPVPVPDPDGDDSEDTSPNPHKTSRNSPFWQQIDDADRYARYARSELGSWEGHERALRAKALDVADFNIDAADIAYAEENVELGNQFYKAAVGMVDVALSMMPVTGNAISMYEAIVGVNPITGDSLDGVGRLIAIGGTFFPMSKPLIKGFVRIVKKLGSKYAKGIVTAIASADAQLAKLGAKGNLGVIGDISGKVLGRWKNSWAKGAINHVQNGDFVRVSPNSPTQLRSGLHTKSGLKSFVSQHNQTGGSLVVKPTKVFERDPVLDDVILSQELPNGVTRIQIPKKGWASQKARNRSIAVGKDGKRYRGVKTLWPKDFSMYDINKAAKKVIKDNPGKVGEIFGEYKGIKVRVTLHKGTRKILSVFPRWEQ